MDRVSAKRRKYEQRKRRVRKKFFGTALRPRMTVSKSHRHICVQAVDDVLGRTLAAVSTLEKELLSSKKSVAVAKVVGQKLAERLNKINVKAVVFDRNGYHYHGIVKAVADGARETGLRF